MLNTYHLLTSPDGTIDEAIQPTLKTVEHIDSDRAMEMLAKFAREGDLLLEIPKWGGPSYAFRVCGCGLSDGETVEKLTAVGTLDDELTVAEKLAMRFVLDGHSKILREVQR